jgi:hypothetical protein
MKTIEVKVYEFAELSETAKQRAIDNYLNKGYDNQFYYDEIISSAKAVAEIFNLKFGGEYTDIRHGHIDDDILNLSGIRLYKYIWNNYGSELFKGKYYGKLVNTNKDGSTIEVSKSHPAGLRHVKRYSKCTLENSCVLTGVCYDDDILQPVYDFLKKPESNVTFTYLIGEIESAIQEAFSNTEDWLNSSEFVTQEIEANDYEFTEDGEEI